MMDSALIVGYDNLVRRARRQRELGLALRDKMARGAVPDNPAVRALLEILVLEDVALPPFYRRENPPTASHLTLNRPAADDK